MKRTLAILLLSVLFVATQSPVRAQSPDSSNYKIAIFAPLYLDSAFDSMDNYRYAKNQFPEFINPGLEFYEGVQLALDSLSKENVPLEVFIIDSKSSQETISQQLNKPELADVDLLITLCGSNEVRTFADFGLQHSIPVININLPNDGGVRNNPYFVMLNSRRDRFEGRSLPYFNNNFPKRQAASYPRITISLGRAYIFKLK